MSYLCCRHVHFIITAAVGMSSYLLQSRAFHHIFAVATSISLMLLSCTCYHCCHHVHVIISDVAIFVAPLPEIFISYSSLLTRSPARHYLCFLLPKALHTMLLLHLQVIAPSCNFAIILLSGTHHACAVAHLINLHPIQCFT